MKVRILVDRAGPNGEWKKGQLVDLPAVEAHSRIRRGHAEDPVAPKVETGTTTGGPEAAVTRSRVAGRRGATNKATGTRASSRKKSPKKKAATRKSPKKKAKKARRKR